MSHDLCRTRLLLVEDDPSAAAFLPRHCARCPRRWTSAGDIAQAVRAGRQAQRHALWLVDAHLPDGDGLDCLARAARSGHDTPALAITAGATREELDALCAAASWKCC